MPRDFSRQSDLVPEEKLKGLKAAVIGVGAVGRNVALQLASIGAHGLTLIDPDVVDDSNVTTQGYRAADVGGAKVKECGNAVNEIWLAEYDPGSRPAMIQDRWRPKYGPYDAVFCCVDSMAARLAIFNGLYDRSQFYADARMLGETCFVYTATNEEQKAKYAETLHGDDEVEPGRCTARSTIYCASFCASAMIHQFARWLRGRQTYSLGGTPMEFLPL